MANRPAGRRTGGKNELVRKIVLICIIGYRYCRSSSKHHDYCKYTQCTELKKGVFKMTKNEKLARRNIQNCINFELGGWENVLLDYPEDAEEYINAKDFLADDAAIVNYIYDCSVSDFYVEGGVYTDTRLISQIKFLGKEKLMSIVDELVSKEGY